MTDTLLRESAILELLRQRYEAEGQVFIAHPPREFLPVFLGDYQPDAIVKGLNESIIIEVKTNSAPASTKLADISSRVTGHPGWRFLLVRASDFTDDELNRSSAAQIQVANSEFERAHHQGLWRSALLVGWSVLESIARELLFATEPQPSRMTPLGLAESLEREGFVDPVQGKQIREIARLRAKVAHGDFSADVQQRHADTLRYVVGVLAARMSGNNARAN